jgi:hypothetical protein
MSIGTWDIGVVKVIKSEKTSPWEGNAENTEVANSFEVLQSNCWECQ